MDDPSVELLSRYRDGDQQAADELFARYMERLTVLARTRLAPKLARRIDPEDVVLSAYRSFFIGASEGRFLLRRSGDLWKLLVRMTLHKLYRQAAHHTAEKRSVDLEFRIDDNDGLVDFCVSREPMPDEVVALSDDLEVLMADLPLLARRVLELRLQGEKLAEIAVEVNHSERTVRRMLNLVRNCIERRWSSDK